MKKLFLILIIVALATSVFASVESQPACTDNDDDGYFGGEFCEDSNDCNDNNPNSWRVEPHYVDRDKDGYYLTGLPNMDSQSRIYICFGEELPEAYAEGKVIGPDCDDNYYHEKGECPIDNEVPEFSIIAGLGVALLAGMFIYKRRK